MKKILLMILFFASIISAQDYIVESVTGSVKVLPGMSETWIDIRPGMALKGNSLLKTETGSIVTIKNNDVRFTLKPDAALNVSSIKKMTVDELLLVLAMEEIIKTPSKKNQDKLKTTVTYGTNESKSKSEIENSNIGLLKLNGAKQLSESGFTESAIASVFETYRQHPSTKSLVNYRIYFADALYSLSLFNEAYNEYNEIKSLRLSKEESDHVNNMINQIKKKISGM